MSQSHASNVWREPAGSGAVPTAQLVVFQFSSGKWKPVVATVPDGRLLDVLGHGKYVLIDVRTEYKLITSGLAVTPSSSGTETAVMATMTNGFKAQAGLVGKAAKYFLDAVRGKLRLVSNLAPECLLVLVGTKVRSY